MHPHEKLADILRTDKDNLLLLDKRLSEVTGKKDVIAGIAEENTRRIGTHLRQVGVSRDASSREIFQSLVSKVRNDEEYLAKAFGNPDASKPEDLEPVLGVLREVAGPVRGRAPEGGSPEDRGAATSNGAGVSTGLFLKKEKAEEFLRSEPPKKVLEYLGYSSADEMLQKEDLFQVYSSLRFVEDQKWMNTVFFRQYEALTPDDFEEREIELLVLDPRWVRAAEHFLTHKFHNISHLKEMGAVFVIPATIGVPGEFLRMTSLIFHYLSEVPYYSDMFRRISEDVSSFSKNFISLLRGDVIDRPPGGGLLDGDVSRWLVVQRYLRKDDPHDWRLFVPHINPEAIHWLRAEENLIEVEKKMLKDLKRETLGRESGLDFWKHMDWVGDYFRSEDGGDSLVSFDLVDVAFSLAKKESRMKFTYHQHEALWNEIFMGYFGREELVRYSQEYLLKGYFEV